MPKKLKLTNSENVVIVDDEDYEWLNQWRWYLGNEGYAQRNDYSDGNHTIIRMHNLLLDAKNGHWIDHINRNKLDNSKNNLRHATALQSIGNIGLASHNTSGYKGVSHMKGANKWRAYIKISRKQKSLGHFNSPEDAAMAYNRAAIDHFGQEFAFLNPIGDV